MEDNLEEGAERVAALRRCIDKLEKAHRELVEQRYRREVPLNDLARRPGPQRRGPVDVPLPHPRRAGEVAWTAVWSTHETPRKSTS